MLKYDELEKDVAEELGIAKTTLNYRKKKVIAFLREHLKDFI
jgi:DNA-directed RNA polymerase specialized sigma subunit